VSDYGPYFTQQGIPGSGPGTIGYTDYAPPRGVDNVLRNCAGTQYPTNPAPDLRDVGFLGNNNQITTKHRVTHGEISDGTSNTIAFAEQAGRQKVYYRGKPNAGGTLLDGGLTLNSGWADYNTARRIKSYDTSLLGPLTGMLEPPNGCATINVSNVNGLYSFHSGGLQALRGDGSVQFLREGVAPGVLAALITRNGGEVFTDN
jgi:hypothetical protein